MPCHVPVIGRLGSNLLKIRFISTHLGINKEMKTGQNRFSVMIDGATGSFEQVEHNLHVCMCIPTY